MKKITAGGEVPFKITRAERAQPAAGGGTCGAPSGDNTDKPPC